MVINYEDSEEAAERFYHYDRPPACHTDRRYRVGVYASNGCTTGLAAFYSAASSSISG